MSIFKFTPQPKKEEKTPVESVSINSVEKTVEEVGKVLLDLLNIDEKNLKKGKTTKRNYKELKKNLQNPSAYFEKLGREALKNKKKWHQKEKKTKAKFGKTERLMFEEIKKGGNYIGEYVKNEVISKRIDEEIVLETEGIAKLEEKKFMKVDVKFYDCRRAFPKLSGQNWLYSLNPREKLVFPGELGEKTEGIRKCRKCNGLCEEGTKDLRLCEKHRKEFGISCEKMKSQMSKLCALFEIKPKKFTDRKEFHNELFGFCLQKINYFLVLSDDKVEDEKKREILFLIREIALSWKSGLIVYRGYMSESKWDSVGYLLYLLSLIIDYLFKEYQNGKLLFMMNYARKICSLFFLITRTSFTVIFNNFGISFNWGLSICSKLANLYWVGFGAVLSQLILLGVVVAGIGMLVAPLLFMFGGIVSLVVVGIVGIVQLVKTIKKKEGEKGKIVVNYQYKDDVTEVEDISPYPILILKIN